MSVIAEVFVTEEEGGPEPPKQVSARLRDGGQRRTP